MRTDSDDCFQGMEQVRTDIRNMYVAYIESIS